jgi:hypothetical protein
VTPYSLLLAYSLTPLAYPTIPEGQDKRSAPALILAGEHDPNAAHYVRYRNLVVKNKFPVKIVLYPGAYRKFDEPGSAVNLLGIRQEYKGNEKRTKFIHKASGTPACKELKNLY